METYIKPSCEIIKMNVENELLAASQWYEEEVGDREQHTPMIPYEILEEEDLL